MTFNSFEAWVESIEPGTYPAPDLPNLKEYIEHHCDLFMDWNIIEGWDDEYKKIRINHYIPEHFLKMDIEAQRLAFQITAKFGSLVVFDLYKILDKKKESKVVDNKIEGDYVDTRELILYCYTKYDKVVTRADVEALVDIYCRKAQKNLQCYWKKD